MQSFEAIYALAAARKGGASKLESLLSRPVAPEQLAKTGDDRWLSAMARGIFQAGFSWRVIETKWPGFEQAFDGFDPARVAFYGDAGVDRLLADKRIVRNGQKVMAVLDNAAFLCALAEEHGTAAQCFAHWPDVDLAGLLQLMKTRGSRLGGNTGQRVLRAMGRDTYVMTPDVTARLAAEGVIDGPVTSKRAMAAIQHAFNTWAGQSGRSFCEISQVLAYSIDH